MWRQLGGLVSHARRGGSLTSNVMPHIKTFVFLDLETTGLPHMEHNLTKITEMCAVAVQADHIELGCFPRVHNKLSFCFNPKKVINPESTDITGLSNELLQHQQAFSAEVVEVMAKWLEMNQKPVCFVAHNGSRFDYPILRAEIDKTGACLPDDLLCVDSLVAFRALDGPVEETPKNIPVEFSDGYDELLSQVSEEYEQSQEQNRSWTPEEVQKFNETTPKKQVIGKSPQASNGTKADAVKRNSSHVKHFTSYKLQDLFTRLTSKQPLKTHEAEGDVVMLITCAAVFGEKFVAYANGNSVKFSDVPPMKPGKRIGT